ncbi:MAG: hypothetical protein RL662_2371 [Bacteroidota bacterium]|jgi:hypothetical protein
MIPILINVGSLMLCTTLGITCIYDNNIIGASAQFFFAGINTACIILLSIIKKL